MGFGTGRVRVGVLGGKGGRNFVLGSVASSVWVDVSFGWCYGVASVFWRGF